MRRGSAGGSDDEIPPAAQFIGSPHDPEAHYGKKGSTCWIGYKVHFTETCEPDAPHLDHRRPNDPATTADGDVTATIHAALQAKELLPQRHLVDTGYLDAPLLVSSQEQFQVDLVGPTRANYQWQAKANTGFALDDFTVDWEAQCAICPEGKRSVKWNPAINRRDNAVIKIGFADRDCQACRSRRSAPVPKERGGCSPSDRKSSMKPCDGRSKRPNLRGSMPAGQALKERSPRGSGSVRCGAVAMWGR